MVHRSARYDERNKFLEQVSTMSEPDTIESLAQRLGALEARFTALSKSIESAEPSLAGGSPTVFKDWRKVVGVITDR